MSGIFGIFNLDGKPVAPQTLQAMHDSMAYWGPDGSGVWRQGHVGLGHLMLYNTPESLFESLPRQQPSHGFAITASARIDNREELFGALSVPHTERANMPDSELILRAYEKWGEDCPDYLLGDWVFALWDPGQHKLFIARDHHGNTGLYYYRNSRFLAFATSLKGLLALPDIPQRLNEFHVAQVLVAWNEHGPPTCYEDIFRLPPAHAMTVTAEKADVRRYWYLEHMPDLRLGSDDEYVEAFLDVFTEAVRCRLRSHRPAGIMLSGGLDSGSVAALAARELGKRGQRLQAFSSVPLYDVEGLTRPNRFGDETPFIEATCQFVGNIDVNYIRAENVSPLKGIERTLDMLDEPQHAAANFFWITALLEAAQQQNTGTLLTGQDGNATISWTGGRVSIASLLSLVKSGQYWNAARRYLAYHLIPEPWMVRIKRWKTGEDSWARYSAINSEIACELNLTNQMALRGHDPTFSPRRDPREHRYLSIKPGRDASGALYHELGAGYDMEARDPTTDKRVLAYCLAIPNNQYVRNGKERFLIRRAMRDILPAKTLHNCRRGRQAADICQRLLQNKREMQAIIAQLEKSTLARRWLNIPVMKEVFHTLHSRMDYSVAGRCRFILLRGLMVGLFLRRFEDRVRCKETI